MCVVPVDELNTLRIEVIDPFSNRIATVVRILDTVKTLPANDLAKWQSKISEAQGHIPQIKLKVRNNSNQMFNDLMVIQNLELQIFNTKLLKYSEYLEYVIRLVEISNSNIVVLTNLNRHITDDINRSLKKQIKNSSTPKKLKPEFQTLLDNFVAITNQIKGILTRTP
jgi:hypothetical protein